MTEVRPLAKMTLHVLLVLEHLVGLDPQRWTFGLDVIRATGLFSGTVYPILARLEVAGWLDREREDIDPRVAGRPVRVLYRLNAQGRQRARAALATRSRSRHVLIAPVQVAS